MQLLEQYDTIFVEDLNLEGMKSRKKKKKKRKTSKGAKPEGKTVKGSVPADGGKKEEPPRKTGKRWGRKISDLGYGRFIRVLAHLAAKHGKQVVKIGRWDKTTGICHNCGHDMGKLPLNVREWTCPRCGMHHDRDVNAARNIKAIGTELLNKAQTA